MNTTSRFVSAKWPLFLLAAVALVLAGCGRKGGLDRPSAASEQPPAAAAADHERDHATKGNLFDPSYGMNGDPAASKGTRKSFILDPLLDSH